MRARVLPPFMSEQTKEAKAEYRLLAIAAVWMVQEIVRRGFGNELLPDSSLATALE